MNKLYPIVLSLLMLSGTVLYAELEVVVTGDRVNLRSTSRDASEVVAQVSEGDLLTALSITNNWVEVKPPQEVDLWVSSEFVQNGTVTARRLNVRGGAGINYQVVGRISRGTDLEVRGEFGEWLKIAPPPGTSLWIHKDYIRKIPPPAPPEPVEPPPPPLKEEPVQERPAPRPLPPRQIHSGGRQAAPPPPPADLVLNPRASQGRLVVHEGLLTRARYLFNRKPVYRLTIREADRERVLCIVRGNTEQLESLRGRRLRVEGHEFWTEDTGVPVLVATGIVVVNAVQSGNEARP